MAALCLTLPRCRVTAPARQIARNVQPHFCNCQIMRRVTGTNVQNWLLVPSTPEVVCPGGLNGRKWHVQGPKKDAWKGGVDPPRHGTPDERDICGTRPHERFVSGKGTLGGGVGCARWRACWCAGGLVWGRRLNVTEYFMGLSLGGKRMLLRAG